MNLSYLAASVASSLALGLALTACATTETQANPREKAPSEMQLSAQAKEKKKDTETPLDLKSRFSQWTQTFKKEARTAEDRWLKQERDFQDALRSELRALEDQGTKLVEEAPNWKEAKKEIRDQKKKLERELKQKIKIHREELELDLMKFTREIETGLKSFVSDIDQQLKEHKNSKGFRDAETDFRSAKEEALNEVKALRERLKRLKTSDQNL